MVLAPTGNNSLSAWGSFEERTYYEAVSVIAGNSKITTISPEALRVLGRLDSKGRQILLPTFETLVENSNLRNMDNEGNVAGLPVVAEAFDKLRNRMSYLATSGRISPDSVYAELLAVNSYIPWDIGYEQHLREVIDFYYEFQQANERSNSVVDFSEFIKSFQDFVFESCPYTSFTLASYSLSRFADPLETGLIVELSSDNPSDDEKKFADYLADPNYSTFVEEAAYYGFLVDKNIPWRIVLNPNSAYVENYLANNSFSSFQNYVENLYVEPKIHNFQLFLEMLYRMYTTLVARKPQYTRFKLSNECNYYNSESREVFTIQNDIVEVVDKVGENTIIKLYAYLRFREANLDLDQKAFNNITRNAINFKKHVDFSKAIEYIEEKAKNNNFTKTRKSLYRI
tara:strand:+ start:1427 stop:2623 length:1197 start_codon:yes stop_codon:yes gene_type:complete